MTFAPVYAVKRSTLVALILLVLLTAVALAYSQTFNVPQGGASLSVTNFYSDGSPAGTTYYNIPVGATTVTVNFSNLYPNAGVNFYDPFGDVIPGAGGVVENPNQDITPIYPYHGREK